MPSSSQTPVGTSSARILLVEEYKALAIAFGSALKKIAPDCETHIVSSLNEAEIVLPELRPTLLILDCDPPPLHPIPFFNRLRSLLPETRVLIVAAENAEEFINGGAVRPTLEFIKKPFDLKKFGALIERLIKSDASSSRGVQHLRLLDIILFHAITETQATLRIDAAGGQTGEIHFAEGRIIHAAVLGKAGLDALHTMLRWQSPRFSEGKRTLDPPHSVRGAWAPVLRAALAGLAFEEPPPPQPLVRPSSRKTSQPPSAKKVAVIDDTDLLLVFVEEVLVTAHPELEIITALSGFDGLKRAVADEPDLLLLDYSLPDLTGGDVCAKLLENEATARIPVIMMSGHVPEMMTAAERFPNIVATISKPFLSSALIELVERTLADLPKFDAPFKKKEPRETPPIEKRERRPEVPRSRNGRARAKKTPPPEPTPTPEPEAKNLTPPGLAEEHIPPSVFDPSPTDEAEIEHAVQKQMPAVEPAQESIREDVEEPKVSKSIPAALPGARSNSVVLGLPLEVSSLELSTRLRVKEIAARPFSATVSLHVLPETLPKMHGRDRAFRLAQVQLDAEGQIDLVRISPAYPRDFRHTRYSLTIDGVEIEPAEENERVVMTPTAGAPIRLELLALFELSAVELAPDFTLEYLVLKARDKRMRATLLPEAIHIGATFTVASISLGGGGLIREMRLIAV